MRINNCEVTRRELDELMLNETCSTSAAEHLKGCSACREFHQTQTKLRQMVGSLGTVAAPPDFDFRLRARLANDSTSGAFHYWPLVQRGFAAAAVLVVFAFGVVVVRNVVNQREQVVTDNNPPVQQESPKPAEVIESKTADAPTEIIAQLPNGPQKIKPQRPAHTQSRIKRPLSVVDFSSQRAEVVSRLDAFSSDATAVIPIDASSHSLKFSLDDGRGNARTISVPAIRFGSQRMLPNGNQFAPKGIW